MNVVFLLTWTHRRSPFTPLVHFLPSRTTRTSLAPSTMLICRVCPRTSATWSYSPRPPPVLSLPVRPPLSVLWRMQRSTGLKEVADSVFFPHKHNPSQPVRVLKPLTACGASFYFPVPASEQGSLLFNSQLNPDAFSPSCIPSDLLSALSNQNYCVRETDKRPFPSVALSFMDTVEPSATLTCGRIVKSFRFWPFWKSDFAILTLWESKTLLHFLPRSDFSQCGSTEDTWRLLN